MRTLVSCISFHPSERLMGIDVAGHPLPALCSVWMCVRCFVAWQDHVITGEGLESTMATNHYGHFLLTTSLLPELNKVRNRGRGGHGPPRFPVCLTRCDGVSPGGGGACGERVVEPA